MEFGATYTFSSSEQFWAELEDILHLDPYASSLDEIDYALREYVAVAAEFMDEFLSTPSLLDSALLLLLSSPLFTSHLQRQTANIISLLSSPTTSTNSSQLFICLMLVLHLGMSNPLAASKELMHNDPQARGGGKVFRAMRAKWGEVVPVLMKWVWDADVVSATATASSADLPEGVAAGGAVGEGAKGGHGEMMPAEGWEERVGTAATAVLYEVCRVQRLNREELALFTYPFISHLFSLVERTRDYSDETFNYTLIKLIIALNEQFMVASLPSASGEDPNDGGGEGRLPPPILPKIEHGKGKKRESQGVEGANLVLECLRNKEGESKTFGENIIFILNRANGSPDSLCVSLLILKILYLLFTTSGTQEYFYTNDLCVLVDVFIRELCDLGEESEGLKHTYLRVLHPLLINTQLRLYPYKRPQLRRVLQSLISNTHYRPCDPTTRRLVERNLRGSWCEGLNDDSVAEGERRTTRRKGSGEGKETMGTGWSSGMGGAREEALRSVGLGLAAGKERTGSTLSVDAIARAEDAGLAGVRGVGRRRTSASSDTSTTASARPFVPPIVIGDLSPSSPLSSSAVLEPVIEGCPSTSIAPPTALTDSPPTTPSSLSSSVELPRRRRPPPPPSSSSSAPPSRPLTPAHLSSTYAVGHAAASTVTPGGPSTSGRRAAPAPPTKGEDCRRVGDEDREKGRRLEEEMGRRLRGLELRD